MSDMINHPSFGWLVQLVLRQSGLSLVLIWEAIFRVIFSICLFCVTHQVVKSAMKTNCDIFGYAAAL